MKPSYKIWAMVAATLVVLRFTITLRTGVISGDDTFLLVRCFGWWHDGDFLPLLSSSGSKGFLYVGLHNFAWAVLAGLCNFRLGPLFVVHAVLMVTPALLLGWQLRGRSEARWAVLLGLSSPLMAYFSLQLLPLWWIASFGGIVALQVAAREDQGKPVGPLGLLLVGLIGGYMCSVYPSLSPLTLGLFFWLLLKRKTRYAQGAYLAGCVAGYTPCAVLLVSRWAELNPQPVVTQAPLAWAPLLGGIFRYIGTPSVDFMNSPGVWMARENNLRTVTVAVWLLLFVTWIFAMIRAQRAGRLLPGSVLLAACSFAVFIPFTLITRTESWYHQAVNLWWIPILIVPWLAYELIPRQARVALAAVVAFNVVGLLVVFGPRLWLGTTTEEGYSNYGRGPSWWMQQKIVDQIQVRADTEISAGVHTPLAVKTDRIYFIFASLPNLFHVQHPGLDGKVKWVVEGLPKFHLIVTRDRKHSNRLRLEDWPNKWHRPEQRDRKAIHLTNKGAINTSVQISVRLPRLWANNLEFIDSAGQALPFWREPGNEIDGDALYWIRLPVLPQGVSTLWVYYEGRRENGYRESPPEKIFEFFDDFEGDLQQWIALGSGQWTVANGVARVALPSTQDDDQHALLLVRDRANPGGLIEARLRFIDLPAKVDAGLAFGARASSNVYLWTLNGHGATELSQFKGGTTYTALGGMNWFWKPKAGRWSVLGIRWLESAMQTFVNGRMVFDTINIGESGIGGVGLGLKRGTGTMIVEYDWVRLRSDFSGSPPLVQIETGEQR